MKSLKGHLLIAPPDMPDSDFSRTVVLLVEHADDGAYGLTLNRPTDLTVKEAWAQNNDTPCHVEAAVFAGGPCGEFLTALHADLLLSNIEVAPGLHYTQEPEKLARLVEEAVDPIKFFVGFAGWDESQLEEELDADLWLTMPASSDHIFSYGDKLWLSLVRQLVGEKTLSALGIKHWPDDPSSN